MLVSEILKITAQSKSQREESKDKYRGLYKNGLKIQTVLMLSRVNDFWSWEKVVLIKIGIKQVKCNR